MLPSRILDSGGLSLFVFSLLRLSTIVAPSLAARALTLSRQLLKNIRPQKYDGLYGIALDIFGKGNTPVLN